MRILLLGKEGQLGGELNRILSSWADVNVLGQDDFELADFDGLAGIVRRIQPDVIVNAAAYTNVDQAESEPDVANAVNGIAPGILAKEARSIGAVLIHYSTDFVFDGSKKTPYTESDTPNPINAYGISKLIGENEIFRQGEAFLIFRTSWVYGLESNNFVTKILNWSRSQKEMRVVDDQIGSPSWTRMLAQVTSEILSKGAEDIHAFCKAHAGLYHLAGTGAASRYDWAKDILDLDPHKEDQAVDKIIPARSAEYPAPAVRPAYSALDSTHIQQTFGIQLQTWREYLRQAMLV
jgi:dTDP-4-dehydrorhamnose reductase